MIFLYLETVKSFDDTFRRMKNESAVALIHVIVKLKSIFVCHVEQTFKIIFSVIKLKIDFVGYLAFDK